jgi:hypothetical protein
MPGIGGGGGASPAGMGGGGGALPEGSGGGGGAPSEGIGGGGGGEPTGAGEFDFEVFSMADIGRGGAMVPKRITRLDYGPVIVIRWLRTRATGRLGVRQCSLVAV